MKMSISQGKIRLENRVLDLATFQFRPKATEQDLETYYDDFIAYAEEIGDYFEDRPAFDIALKDASKEKRPKLIAREPKYPFLYLFRASFHPFSFLFPEKRRLHDKYFTNSQCIANISRKDRNQKGKTLHERLSQDITEKFKQYPGYECIIEVSNDRNPADTKATTFHEGIHYLLLRYQAETRRDIFNKFTGKDLTDLDRYRSNHMIHENITEILADKLLTHDPDAQFENRWTHYSLAKGIDFSAYGISALATGLFIFSSIHYPYLLPLVLTPSRIRDFAIEKHKKSKREEILKLREYPKFKI